MTDLEPFSKSQQKQNAKDITNLGNQLALLSEEQLNALPFPEIQEAIKEYKRISKGNARKRQMLFIGKLLRQVDLAATLPRSHPERDRPLRVAQHGQQRRQWRR